MWFAIALLASGICVVQMAAAKEKKQGSMANAAEQNVMKGYVHPHVDSRRFTSIHIDSRRFTLSPFDY
jgi:hypothetical protein